MADQTVEIKFGFIRTITGGSSGTEITRRVEDVRKRLERELQLATKDNDLKLRAQLSYLPRPVSVDALHPRTV